MRSFLEPLRFTSTSRENVSVTTLRATILRSLPVFGRDGDDPWMMQPKRQAPIDLAS